LVDLVSPTTAVAALVCDGKELIKGAGLADLAAITGAGTCEGITGEFL
jgi:hypothetical protein